MSLSRLIDERLAALPLPAAPGSLYDPIRYTIGLGGKRIRPQLVCLACGLQGAPPTDAIDAAIAVELLHTFTLIHDDIMDNADTRRGKPTVMRKWNSNTAILSGDALHTVSMRQLAPYASHSDYGAIIDRFLHGIQLVCEGQAYDLEFETRTDVTLAEYLTMIELKTSVLIQVGMEIGAMIGGADEERTRITGQIGLKTGLAFQIQDDLLDAVADPTTFGKKAAGDIREGKKTFLTLLLLEHCAPEDRTWVNGVLHRKSANDSDVRRMLELYRGNGILEAAETAIQSRYAEAEAALARFPDNGAKTGIGTILKQLATRES